MKFTFAIQKMGKAEMTIARGHNCREHHTASQLDKRAWFSEKGGGFAVQWDKTKVQRAEGLAKRKDAVVGIEFVVQVGNQTDWREPPTPEHPEGKPKEVNGKTQRDMCLAVKEWAEQTFGAENVVGIHLHLDESTPHVHAVVTPIKDGKLQAKAWLNGGASVAALRKSCHAAMNARIPCEYTPHGAGGQPHREDLRAGSAPVPTLIDKMTGHARAKELERENGQLRQRVAQLEQVLFSRQKTLYRAEMAAAAERALAEAEAAGIAQSAAERAQREAMRQVQELSQQIQQRDTEIEVLKRHRSELADENNELQDKLRELMPRRDNGPSFRR
ncbi:MAG: plasmid recombination protein [Aeromonadaceae bacterium]